MEVKPDLLKIKEIIEKLLEADGSHKYQIGDLLIDIDGMIQDRELKDIVVFNTGTETEEWKINQRMSPSIGQKALLKITPNMWMKESDNGEI